MVDGAAADVVVVVVVEGMDVQLPPGHVAWHVEGIVVISKISRRTLRQDSLICSMPTEKHKK